MRKLYVLGAVALMSVSLFAMGNMKDSTSTANGCKEKAKSCCCKPADTTTSNCSCCCCGTPATTTTTGSAIKK